MVVWIGSLLVYRNSILFLLSTTVNDSLLKLKPFLFVYDLWNCYVKIQKVSWILALPHATSSETHEENDGNIKKERAKVDSMIKHAGEQTDKELENERSKLKSLIESLIQQEEFCANMNVDVTTIR